MNTKRQTPWRLLAAIVLALGLAIAPFAVLGAAFEEQVLDWFQQPWSAAARFWAVVLILASDLFLPIPSSAVCTYAGAQLGFVAATASGWLGMTIGAMLGYSLARVAGWALASRLASAEDVERLKHWPSGSAVTLLILTRPLPILAEAAVVLAGLLRVPLGMFLWPVLVCNVLLAAIYSALGHWSLGQGLLWPMVIFSGTVPLGLSWFLRRRRPADE